MKDQPFASHNLFLGTVGCKIAGKMTSEFERELRDIRDTQSSRGRKASDEYRRKKEREFEELMLVSKQIDSDMIELGIALGNIVWEGKEYQQKSSPGVWLLSQKEFKNPSYPDYLTTESFHFQLSYPDRREPFYYFDKSLRLKLDAGHVNVNASHNVLPILQENNGRIYQFPTYSSVSGEGARYLLRQPFDRKLLESLFRIAYFWGPQRITVSTASYQRSESEGGRFG